jgi:hypothetical protein
MDTLSTGRRLLPWVLLGLVVVGVAWYHYSPSPAPPPKSLQQTLDSSSVVVITAIDRTAPPGALVKDYFVRLDADTWHQFKSDPAATTRFVFRQLNASGERMTLRDSSRGVEITLTFDFARKTVHYRQADQPQGYELFDIVGVQALPK